MNKMIILFLLVAGSVFSQSYYLNVWSKGKVTSIPVSEIHKLTFTNSTGIINNSKDETLVTTFQLFQNYPNPFNPSTRIDYQIIGSGYVDIKIYNINGELVKTLFNSSQSPGKYSVVWNGKDDDNRLVASGMYIYRVMFENSILSKKMLLLK